MSLWAQGSSWSCRLFPSLPPWPRPFSMPSILIVDDEAGIRDSLAGVLTDEGYTVSSVESGEACLDVVKKTTFDVILLDIWLPGIDGLDALGKVQIGRASCRER